MNADTHAPQGNDDHGNRQGLHEHDSVERGVDSGSQDARRHRGDEAHHEDRGRGEHPEHAERPSHEHVDKYAGEHAQEQAAESSSDTRPSGTETSDTRSSDTETSDEREARQAQFAREHDPATHDIAAGESARQPGDWTADEAGGEQVWDADGNLVQGEHPGAVSPDPSAGTGATDGAGSGAPVESSLDEIRDGGYGVGSAAPIEGKVPLGHPVKAWEDTKTYAVDGDAAYAAESAHVWFTDADAAERAGFDRAD